MKRLVILTVILAAGCVGACETPRSAGGGEEGAAPSIQEATKAQLEEVRALRQRQEVESLGVVVGDPAEVAREGLPDEVAEEWAWLRRALFGGAEVALEVDDSAFSQAARFDGARGQVVVKMNPATDEVAAFAFDMAVNEGLEFLAFKAMEPPKTVEEWVAVEIARRAGPAFASTLSAAKRAGLEVSVDELALRPELSLEVPVVGERLKSGATVSGDGADHVEASLRRLVLREAVALGAALYRAGGWSGVEWGRIEPPKTSDYAVRPDRWLGGEGQGQWEWPESFEAHRQEREWDEVATGTVGSAMMAVWLEGIVDSRGARTVFSGWLADTYRVYTRGEGDSLAMAFNWLSAWQTPHEAQEIGGAVEAALAHYLGREHRRTRYRVAVQGVNVAVALYEEDRDPALLNEEVELLTTARLGIVPEDRAPISFVPTLYEHYAQIAEGSTLEEDRWVDAAAGWAVEVDALEGWSVQKSDEAHVRWFAVHPDSTVLQWTTELVNPLRASFGSPAYLESLKEVFSASVQAEEPPFVEVRNQPVEPMVEMEVVGVVEGRPVALRLWQWRRGDVLVTFSVQGPEESFGDRLTEAEAVVESLVTYGTAVGEGRRQTAEQAREDEGIIEFQMEE